MRPEPSGDLDIRRQGCQKSNFAANRKRFPCLSAQVRSASTTQWLLLSLHLRGLKGVILSVVSRGLERHSRTFFLSHLVATPRGLQNACVQTATASSFLPLHLCSLHRNFYNFVLRPSYRLEDCRLVLLQPWFAKPECA